MTHTHRMLIFFLLIMLTTSREEASLGDNIRSGAASLSDAPTKLDAIPQQLTAMYASIRSKIPAVQNGITQLTQSLESAKKAKALLLKNQDAPEEIKTKLLAALGKLELVFPALITIFTNLKNTMDRDASGKIQVIVQQISSPLLNKLLPNLGSPTGWQRSRGNAAEENQIITEISKKIAKVKMYIAGWSGENENSLELRPPLATRLNNLAGIVDKFTKK